MAVRRVAQMLRDEVQDTFFLWRGIGQITFILAQGIGEAVIAPDVDLGEVERLLTGTLAAHRVG